jgi:hypothetical protein
MVEMLVLIAPARDRVGVREAVEDVTIEEFEDLVVLTSTCLAFDEGASVAVCAMAFRKALGVLEALAKWSDFTAGLLTVASYV